MQVIGPVAKVPIKSFHRCISFCRFHFSRYNQNMFELKHIFSTCAMTNVKLKLLLDTPNVLPWVTFSMVLLSHLKRFDLALHVVNIMISLSSSHKMIYMLVRPLNTNANV